MSDIKDCNITINGQKYYSDFSGITMRVAGDLSTIALDFALFTSCLCCFLCMLIIALILHVSGSSPIVVLVLSLCCCVWSTYYYYGYSGAMSDLEKLGTDLQNDKSSRPCRDALSGLQIN